MELIEVMRTMNACRHYRPDPVPDEVFYRAIESARFAPQGGNRQPVRFLIVCDTEKKRKLGEWYLQRWEEILNALESGERTMPSSGRVVRPTWLGFSDPAKVMRDTDQFARRFGEHPAIVVVCADLAAVHPTDADLGRLSIVGGASVYPMVQNFCLALRDQGVATTLTTLLVAHEEKVKELLHIPEAYSTACHVVAGYPARGFPTKLNRRPVEELGSTETFGRSLTANV